MISLAIHLWCCLSMYLVRLPQFLFYLYILGSAEAKHLCWGVMYACLFSWPQQDHGDLTRKCDHVQIRKPQSPQHRLSTDHRPIAALLPLARPLKLHHHCRRSPQHYPSRSLTTPTLAIHRILEVTMCLHRWCAGLLTVAVYASSCLLLHRYLWYAYSTGLWELA